MTTPRSSLSTQFGSRLLAGVGTLTLLAAIGLFASRPAHTAAGPIPVTVANTVQNSDVDNETRQPVDVIRGIDTVADSAFSLPVYTVPAGKRLVVENLSLTGGGPGANCSCLVRNHDDLSNDLSFIGLTTGPVLVGIGGVTKPVRMHVEPGNMVSVDMYETGGGGVHAAVSLSGYLVNVP